MPVLTTVAMASAATQHRRSKSVPFLPEDTQQKRFLDELFTGAAEHTEWGDADTPSYRHECGAECKGRESDESDTESISGECAHFQRQLMSQQSTSANVEMCFLDTAGLVHDLEGEGSSESSSSSSDDENESREPETLDTRGETPSFSSVLESATRGYDSGVTCDPLSTVAALFPRRHTPGYEAGGSSLAQAFAMYGDFTNTALSDKTPRCLVLSGMTRNSALHHLGVVCYLVESGRLCQVGEIWAEGYGIYLAVLLKHHWALLCAVDGTTLPPDQLQQLLIVPMMRLLYAGAPMEMLELRRKWTFLKAGTTKHARWWKPDALPRLSVCVTSPVDLTTYVMDDSDFYSSGLEIITTLLCINARNVLEGSRHYATIWSALCDNLLRLRRLECLCFCVSYAGTQRLPPHDEANLGAVGGDMHAPYDFFCFCNFASKASDDFKNSPISAILYSPYNGENFSYECKSPGSEDPGQDNVRQAMQCKSAVCAVYGRGDSRVVASSSLATAMVNWAYTVAWTAELIADQQLSSLSQIPSECTFERLVPLEIPTVAPVTRKARKRPLTMLSGAYRPRATSAAINTSEVSLSQTPGQLAAASRLREHKHTPCKWLKSLFRK